MPDESNPILSIEEQLTAAHAALADAQLAQQSMTAERDAAHQALASAQTEVARLTDQFNSASQTASTAQAEIVRLNIDLAAITASRDTTTGLLAAAESNITRLEKLCGIHGVDPASAVPSASEKSASPTLAELAVAVQSAPNAAARMKAHAAWQAAQKS